MQQAAKMGVLPEAGKARQLVFTPRPLLATDNEAHAHSERKGRHNTRLAPLATPPKNRTRFSGGPVTKHDGSDPEPDAHR